MVKAIIIDDEKNAIDVLNAQIKNYCPEIKIIEKCHDAELAVELITTLKPDLVFLDIEMPRVNGFDVLDRTSTINYKVIFTTAYDQFAIKAFRYSAIDYLLKPIDIEELKSAVKKVLQSEKQDLEKILSRLQQYLRTSDSHSKKIAIPTGEGFEMIQVQDIVRCESDGNYTTIFLHDKRKIILTRTLKEVEELLPCPPFIRIHHSHLINLDCILKWFKADGGYVVMSDGSQINISRSRKDAFFEIMQKL